MFFGTWYWNMVLICLITGIYLKEWLKKNKIGTTKEPSSKEKALIVIFLPILNTLTAFILVVTTLAVIFLEEEILKELKKDKNFVEKED